MPLSEHLRKRQVALAREWIVVDEDATLIINRLIQNLKASAYTDLPHQPSQNAEVDIFVSPLKRGILLGLAG